MFGRFGDAAVMVRRIVESGLAAAAALALSPVLLVAAIGVRLSSRGPIFYRASRVGLGGKNFQMYKLRTMHCEAAGPASRITAAGDPRIFAFGSLLRRLKIDELPQLFNIIRGEMAFVGPRPEDPFIVANHYTPEQMETLRVRPGLASPGTLFYYTRAEKWVDPGDPEGSYARHILPIKLALDLVYVREASLLYDLRIALGTLWALVSILCGRTAFRDRPEMRKIQPSAPSAAQSDMRGPVAPGEAPAPTSAAD